MPRVTFIEANGTRHELELTTGQSLMEGVVSHAVPGMTGECSGSLACGTCHCFIDEVWMQKAGAPCDIENELLDCTSVKRTATSRLGCQVRISDQLDGLVVRLPSSQY